MTVIDRKKEIHLARVNGRTEQLFVQDVRQAVRQQKEPEDEIAILRKMVMRQHELIESLLGESVTDAVVEEFKEYYDEVEQLKKEIKAEIGIKTEGDTQA